MPLPALLSAQVINTTRRRRLVRIRHRVVFGTFEAVQQVLAACGGQINPIRVDDAEHGRGGQEDLSPCVMGPEEAKEAGALREPGNQRIIVAGQPPIKRVIAHTIDGMQQPHGDHLTGPEVGLGRCGEACQLVINLTEAGHDTRAGGSHRRLRSSRGGTLSTSVEAVHGHDKKTDEYYWIYWFASD